MCGRFTLRANATAVADLFNMPEPPPQQPRYNIAPSQMVLALRATGDGKSKEWAMLKWGTAIQCATITWRGLCAALRLVTDAAQFHIKHGQARNSRNDDTPLPKTVGPAQWQGAACVQVFRKSGAPPRWSQFRLPASTVSNYSDLGWNDSNCFRKLSLQPACCRLATRRWITST